MSLGILLLQKVDTKNLSRFLAVVFFGGYQVEIPKTKPKYQERISDTKN